MDVGTLEQWLWDAACEIRGPLDAPKFKDYILPLVFLKRLSDVFDGEVARLAGEFGSEDAAAKLVDADHGLVRFYIPEAARWSEIAKKTAGLGEYLTDAVRAVARENPKLQGVIDVQDFNQTAAGQRVVDDARLQRLVQVLGKHRLGLDDVEPDLLGRAYEYLLRKFAEGGGASAGEFYTPREVAMLMARILDPQPGMTIYDPCCGSAGLLIKQHLRLLETHGKPVKGRLRLPEEAAPLRVFGQELNPSTFAMARMNAFIHDIEAEIAYGDTIKRPRFLDNSSLKRFDLVAANPMWNQPFPDDILEHDPYGRMQFGVPTPDRGDWAWIQHMLASTTGSGRLAVVLDTGSVSRGSEVDDQNKELLVRQAILEADLIDAVVLLPSNLFYNTSGQGLILVLNKAKRHRGEVLLINSETLFVKDGPKNRLPMSEVERIAGVYEGWETDPGFSVVMDVPTLLRARANLTPSRYIEAVEAPRPAPEDVVLLVSEAEIEARVAARAMQEFLGAIGLSLDSVEPTDER